jgi:nucleotide-binding universal stress UspA family protein
MFRRILLAVDGTESGEVAASFTGGVASQSSAVVRVVHVNELLVGGRGFARHTDKEARQIVDAVARTLVRAGVPATGEVRVAPSFDVPSRIADAASDWGADVIVLGSRRRRPLSVLGRFSRHGMHKLVTSRTTLPTLIAPAPLAFEWGRQTGQVGLPFDLSEAPSAHSR